MGLQRELGSKVLWVRGNSAAGAAGLQPQTPPIGPVSPRARAGWALSTSILHVRLAQAAVNAMVIGHVQYDHSRMISPTNLPRLPTDEEFALRLAELRQVSGVDLATLAARANLEPEVVAEIEAGKRPWTVDELSALAFGLGMTMTAICRHWDPPAATSAPSQ